MIKIQFIRLLILAGVILMPVMMSAQEFPVAVGSDTTFSAGAVYGGENGLVAILGNALNSNNITAQLIGASGTLIGSRISLGAIGVMPGPIPIFDGTNYFLVWLEFNGDLKGQFINTSGSLVGASFVIASDISINRLDYRIGLSDESYLVVFVKTNNYLCGQRISTTGNLIGDQIQISSNYARDISIAYDGTNYLVAWVEQIPDTDKDIFGQFISKAGAFVGSNFLIDGGPNYSDNPTSIAFDGARYLLAFHEVPSTGSKWTLMGKFITASGTIQETITIRDSSTSPGYPSVAFDNSNYLITWGQRSNGLFMGRFYNVSGIPIGEPFEIFSASENKMPIGGVGFGGNLYLAVATKVNASFSDGDVYGRFIQPITDVETENNMVSKKYALFQNYPNPCNPSTKIQYNIEKASMVSLKVYNVLGNDMATLVHGNQDAGNYTVSFSASEGNTSALSSGVYFYRLQAGTFVSTKKLILMK